MGWGSGEAAEDGVEDDGFEEEEEDDGEERTEGHARSNGSGVGGGVSGYVHESTLDDDDAEGSSWAAWRTAPLGDTRRRGRGPTVSPSTGVDDRTRRRGRQATAHHHSRSGGEGKTSTAGAVLQLLLTFLCCCCCCPGGPCDCKAGWAAKVGRSLRILAARHRGLLFCFCVLLALVNYFVTMPLLSASLVALLENEELFVERMRIFGLPPEVSAMTAPRAVAVTMPRDPRLAAAAGGGGAGVGHTVRSARHSGGAAPHRPHFAPPLLPAFLLPLFGRRTLALAQLPAWTLFPLSPVCVECVEDGAYAAAVAAHATAPPSAMRQGVYATSTSPLGRVGPMLLAMASVTDDVAVREELSKWPWVPRMAHQAELLRRSQAGTPPAHLAVLGVPSTDTPVRAALRVAQRQTWMTYVDVARTENDFTGRLLVLYVLAASERTRVQTSWLAEEAGPPPADFLSVDAQRLRADPSLLLPTAAEYAAAEEYYYTVTTEAAVETNAKDTDISYVRRRMRLLRGWRREASTGSPCDSITDVVWTAHEGAVAREGGRVNVSSTPLADLAEALELPVAPLFSTPAAFVCHASTALWQEALAHRNMLWVDMMTDRIPTAVVKKIGHPGNWGLPVDVGMSQKLILWLSYAYHAFPDVPFIVKGDDDTYLKVPQYLSDIHYMQRGRSGRALDELTTTESPRGLQWVRRAFSSAAPTGEDYLRTKATEECMYWGSMRRWNGEVYFGAGMMFLLHRRLVQTVLEERPEYNNDVVRLAVQDYKPRYAHSYFAAMMDHEDVMVGKLLAERRVRALQLCPYYRAWYVWETWERFHDVHYGRVRNVTWSTTVAHRCTTTDLAFLHFYFQNEYRYGRTAAGAVNKEDDEIAQQAAQAWLAQLRAERLGDDPAAAAETTNNNKRTKTSTAAAAAVADVLWSVPDAMNHTPLPYVLSAQDKVAVYEVEYSPFTDGYLVLDGWVANTRRSSSRQKQ